ncbi:SDR family oxidoreductase [Pelagibacterium luteolum]|uniref:NAD(P)-dependent dehydrogenase, short-chain alcohol dehydrogenase family n=1 Tax=Pelagibacterium luteolum TaxID=440168 RepID=A0A1G7ZDV5_9HYPH|nr:SDR family oxidoreductase [Pelagibacterium luteolum]SDH06878.1 NAD(P)-dependent dehydrogenase, short-chain alcohol dehydrogenase family [Pelagibacterium luteolum]
MARRAIVTGGAGLIGTGICKRLNEEGWEIAAFDLKSSEIGTSIICDVGSEASVAAAFDALGWDRLDLLVNNSGIAGPDNSPIAELSLSDWRKVIDSHLTGAFLVTRTAVRLMGTGSSIINMASTRAFMSEPNTEAYAASKGGLVALTHSLAISLGPDIRVNAIAPGWITEDTALREKDHAQHPVGRVGRPEDIAQAVLYLADAGFVTGQVLTVDGGMTRKMIYAE